MGTWLRINVGDTSIETVENIVENGSFVGTQYYNPPTSTRDSFIYLAEAQGFFWSAYQSTLFPGYYISFKYNASDESINAIIASKINNGNYSYYGNESISSRVITRDESSTRRTVYGPDLPFEPFNSYAELVANLPPPPSVSVPITYYPTGCVLQGPSEAEQGDTVNVLVTPGPGKVIKPESIQVYNRSGLITHTYASGILSFDVPDGQ